jgi:hypothetical protein
MPAPEKVMDNSVPDLRMKAWEGLKKSPQKIKFSRQDSIL